MIVLSSSGLIDVSASFGVKLKGLKYNPTFNRQGYGEYLLPDNPENMCSFIFKKNQTRCTSSRNCLLTSAEATSFPILRPFRNEKSISMKETGKFN